MEGLPNGKAWYAYNVKRITTTDYTPEQIHQIGLDEVKRIHGEMEGVMKQVGFKGTRDEFFKHLNTDPQFFFDKREDLIAGYDAIRKRVNPQLPKLFEILPKADYEVRAVEPFREKSAAGGQYQAANEDGTRPGIFYANAYDLRARPKWAMEALSLHEANPGHHFQISIQREQQGLPKFRRFGGYTAYSEGWGLYAESLGNDLGMYTDPYQYFGRLEGELWRAIRLVVDTGLHCEGLDPRAGARVHGREQLRRRGTARVRGRALHGDPGPGARVQDRPAQDQRAACARREGARDRSSTSAGSTRPCSSTARCRSTCSKRRSIAGSPASAETGGRASAKPMPRRYAGLR